MSARDRSRDSTPQHPGEPGSYQLYRVGCRCDECRASNARLALDRRKRVVTGRLGPNDLVPNAAVRAAIMEMRRLGMVWDGMAELVGCDRRDLQRMLKAPDGKVTRRMDAAITAAARSVRMNPSLQDRQKHVLDGGANVRWMVGCLLARGWDSQWIGNQIGWKERFSTSTIKYDLVNVRTLARLEGVFKAYHDQWGSSRMTAVRAWRAGKFLSDCYDWEEDGFDFRPIPGSLHPDLVVEACTFSEKHVHRASAVRAEMRRVWGQWESERCACAAGRAWRKSRGFSLEPVQYREECGLVIHGHDVLPEVWRTP